MRGSPVFIGGFPSGGTDLTKTVLNAHPEVYINGEMPFLRCLLDHGYRGDSTFSSLEEIDRFRETLRSFNTWDNIENLDHDFRADIKQKSGLELSDVLQIMFSFRTRVVWGNKTPQNTENMTELAELFPKAKFLIVARDVRDICLSWRKKWGKDMTLCAAKWAERMASGWRVAQQLPRERTLFFKFEDLLTNTSEVCCQICDFLGLEFSNRMLSHHEFIGEKIDGKRNYGEPIKRENMRNWQREMSRRKLKRIEEIAYETMQIYGYQVTCGAAHFPITSWEVKRGRANDLAALLLVGNRARKRNGVVERWGDLVFEVGKMMRRPR